MGELTKITSHNSEALKEKAFLWYITQECSMQDVSDKFNISVNTLRGWSKKHKWKLFRNHLGDKLEGILELSSERVAYFEALMREFHSIMANTYDVREKVLATDMILKLDKRVSAWLLLGEMSE